MGYLDNEAALGVGSGSSLLGWWAARRVASTWQVRRQEVVPRVVIPYWSRVLFEGLGSDGNFPREGIRRLTGELDLSTTLGFDKFVKIDPLAGSRPDDLYGRVYYRMHPERISVGGGFQFVFDEDIPRPLTSTPPIGPLPSSRSLRVPNEPWLSPRSLRPPYGN